MIKKVKRVNNIIGGNMFQIILLIIAIIVLFFFFGKIKIVLTMGDEVCIDGYILECIKVKRYRFNEKEIRQIKSRSPLIAKDEVKNYLKNIEFTDAKIFFKNIKELLAKVQFKKIDFKLNVNVNDYILNAYITTFINTIVAMIISKNIERINTEDLYYVITSDEKKIKLNLKCIMYGKIANIMFVIIKIIYYALRLKKRGNEKYGKGTSNRKFNGNSNVVA